MADEVGGQILTVVITSSAAFSFHFQNQRCHRFPPPRWGRAQRRTGKPCWFRPMLPLTNSPRTWTDVFLLTRSLHRKLCRGTYWMRSSLDLWISSFCFQVLCCSGIAKNNIFFNNSRRRAGAGQVSVSVDIVVNDTTNNAAQLSHVYFLQNPRCGGQQAVICTQTKLRSASVTWWLGMALSFRYLQFCWFSEDASETKNINQCFFFQLESVLLWDCLRRQRHSTHCHLYPFLPCFYRKHKNTLVKRNVGFRWIELIWMDCVNSFLSIGTRNL